MSFYSILYRSPNDFVIPPEAAPDFFRDLQLGQIVDAVTADWEAYNLAPFFFSPLRDLDAIAFRQEVMRDLQDAALLQVVKSFSEQMRAVRRASEHANDLYYQQAIQRRFLEAVEKYCLTVDVFARELAKFNLASRGLQALRDFLTQYTTSAEFRRLVSETQRLTLDLSAIKYSVVLNDGSINVREYGGESDYSTSVEDIHHSFEDPAAVPANQQLEKFRQVRDQISSWLHDFVNSAEK